MRVPNGLHITVFFCVKHGKRIELIINFETKSLVTMVVAIAAAIAKEYD